MIKLFPDQQKSIDDLRASMQKNKSILFQAPTGFGKTACATYMINSALSKGKRAVFTVPRRSLCGQSSDNFNEQGINHSFVAAGRSFNPYAKTYIGMIDTMARRMESLPKADVAFIDECHFGATALDKVINYYKESGAWVIGLSATPWKLNGQGLGRWFDDMVCGPPIRWLIDNKRLSDYRYFRGKTKVDFSKARVSGGEYNSKDVDGIVEANEKVIIGDAVRDYKEKAMGRLHLVRCVSIKRSQRMAESFRNAGVPAMHVDGNLGGAELKKILISYARREILVITFCDLLNFGFDLAMITGMKVCVESGDDTKPSLSLAGQMQWWGRMLRYKEYPALIFDRVNNYLTHDLPCTDREWSLEDREQKKSSAGGGIATKQCENCFFVFRPAPFCPECGHVVKINDRKIKEAEGELEEITKLEKREKNKSVQTLAKQIMYDEAPQLSKNDENSLEYLINKFTREGVKNPTAKAAHVLAARISKKGK